MGLILFVSLLGEIIDKYRKVCEECVRVKKICVKNNDDNKCENCVKNGFYCVFKL